MLEELVREVGMAEHASLVEGVAEGNRASIVPSIAHLLDCGVRRVNVSLDTLDPAKFTEITRRGRLDQVLDGLAAAKRAGLAVKINTVALRGVNDEEMDDLVAWCGDEGFDLVAAGDSVVARWVREPGGAVPPNWPEAPATLDGRDGLAKIIAQAHAMFGRESARTEDAIYANYRVAGLTDYFRIGQFPNCQPLEPAHAVQGEGPH